MKSYNTIFEYIEGMEALYKTPIRINDIWSWSMREHITTSELYKNSQLTTGKDDFKPVKNITRPILNLQYRTEDIDVRDVQIYVDDPSKYHLSFLVKKYHDDVFTKENDIDTYFDQLNISRIDFGGGLSKKLNKPAPEVVPLQSIAFCDQTDILAAPIGIKHYYSPDQFLEMSKVGWGDKANGATVSLEDAIRLAREEDTEKENTDGRNNASPGHYIEVYEVHGNLPKRFADTSDTSESYENRLWIVTFYQSPTSRERAGLVLFTKPEPESPFKLIKRDPIHGRALGMGGAEELFEPQVWVNYDMIRMQGMLDSASKTILKAVGINSTAVAARNNLKTMENMQILDLGQDTDLVQVDTFPRNLSLFEKSVAEWEAHAQQMGAANDSIMGESPASGTPFKLQELVTNESRGLHEYRRGQFARHLEEIYRDWIIPHIQKKITQGARFLSELSLEELEYVTEHIVRNQVGKDIKDKIFSGQMVTQEEKKALEEQYRQEFKRNGPKLFVEILKGEFKDAPLAVKVSVAGKSKNLSMMTDKLVNIFRQVVVNPAVLQVPALAQLFNQIIEASGLDPVDFSAITKEQIAATQPQDPQQQQMQLPQGAPQPQMA